MDRAGWRTIAEVFFLLQKYYIRLENKDAQLSVLNELGLIAQHIFTMIESELISPPMDTEVKIRAECGGFYEHIANAFGVVRNNLELAVSDTQNIDELCSAARELKDVYRYDEISIFESFRDEWTIWIANFRMAENNRQGNEQTDLEDKASGEIIQLRGEVAQILCTCVFRAAAEVYNENDFSVEFSRLKNRISALAYDCKEHSALNYKREIDSVLEPYRRYSGILKDVMPDYYSKKATVQTITEKNISSYRNIRSDLNRLSETLISFDQDIKTLRTISEEFQANNAGFAERLAAVKSEKRRAKGWDVVKMLLGIVWGFIGGVVGGVFGNNLITWLAKIFKL